MSDEQELTGTIRNYFIEEMESRFDPEAVNEFVKMFPNAPRPLSRVRGNVIGDIRRRFPDGMIIYTSLITEAPDENGIVKTLYSRYKLEEPWSRTPVEVDLPPLDDNF